MPDILLVILAVIFVLGVAINIHEFGHFIVAKILGMRVEAYSFFGLGPRLWGFKVGHTDYRVSAIPLGAYVKLYGDEATAALEGGESDGEKVPDEELYELRPRWQKFLVMVGGPFMNIVLALGIPFFGAMMYGVPSMPAPIVGITDQGGAAQVAGIQAGDRIIAMNGAENPTWEAVRDESLISPGRPIQMTVDRGGNKIPLTVTPVEENVDGNKIGNIGMRPDAGVEPVVTGSVNAGAAAEEAGLKVGDNVIAFNGATVRNGQELVNQIRENKDAPGKLTVERNGERLELNLVARLNDKGNYSIGAGFGAGTFTTRVPVGAGGALAFAYESNMRILRLTGRVFGQMFSGERSVSDAGLAGPVGIVQIISKVVREAGFVGLFSILAVISLNLGIFNLLPIPLLDGGQILVLGIEKVLSWFGATLSMAVREYIQYAGLGIILLLMVFTLFLDISRLF